MLRALLIERILGAVTEEDLAEQQLTARDLDSLSDVDLFELYEDRVFKALL